MNHPNLQSDIRLITEKDIPELLGIGTEESDRALRDRMRTDIDELLDNALKRVRQAFVAHDGILVKSDMDNVALRVESIYLLLASFESALQDTDRFQRTLFTCGLGVGRSFFDDFWAFQLRIRVIPKSYRVLLALWEGYDSSAGFGSFKLTSDNIAEPGMELLIRKSFLVRHQPDSTRAHGFCAFILGYVHGVISGCLFVLPRWLRDQGLLPPRPLKIASMEHESVDDHDCRLLIRLDHEKLGNAYDKLYSAKWAIEEKNYIRSILQARSAMESAAKMAVGLSDQDHTSFHRLVRELSRYAHQRYAPVLTSAREYYGIASDTIHRGMDVDRRRCSNIILGATEFLDFLENHLRLRDHDRDSIARNLRDTASEGPAAEPSQE